MAVANNKANAIGVFFIIYSFIILFRDADATTRMLMGGSIGSSLVPMFIGYSMKMYGPDVLTVFVLLLGLGMSFAYLNAHYCLTIASKLRRKLFEQIDHEQPLSGDVLRNTISASNLERHNGLHNAV